jgi:hypothetical protein
MKHWKLYIYISLIGIFRFDVWRSQHMKCITGKFVFHVILINYTTFFQIFVNTSCELLHRHVTKDALPKEFGGNLDSMASYQSKLYGTSTVGITAWNYLHLLCLLRQEQVLKCNYHFLSLQFRIYSTCFFLCIYRIILMGYYYYYYYYYIFKFLDIN